MESGCRAGQCEEGIGLSGPTYLLLEFSQFSRTKRQYWLIALQTTGLEILLVLIRVCRAFRDIFQPFLYAQFRFILNKRHPWDLERSNVPKTFRYTKEFEVVFKRLTDVEVVMYETHQNKGYASFISRALRAMPNLRTFRWFDCSMDERCDPSLILQNRELLATLESAPNLRELTLQYCALNSHGPHDLYKRTTQLQGFKNLTSLEIYGFFGAHSDLVEDIANVLKDYWSTMVNAAFCESYACGMGLYLHHWN
jgi:hypothetical protein